jgi:hypothetical protein
VAAGRTADPVNPVSLSISKTRSERSSIVRPRIATFEDLAGDAVAAVGYLKTRRDIDASQIRLLGCSQAGWIMPLAAIRAKDIAFLISI